MRVQKISIRKLLRNSEIFIYDYLVYCLCCISNLKELITVSKFILILIFNLTFSDFTICYHTSDGRL